ncbi:MAG: hypothetical protein ACOYJZ_07570 [Acutalibacter sp.]|jgi:hypothetical protein
MGAIKVLRAVLGVILCALLGVSLWLTVQRQVFHQEELTLPGAVVVPVTGDTMTPALTQEDLAVILPGAEDCSLGDAVLCEDGSFQRLVGTVDGEFIARGDNESQELEALLPAGEIRGRVTWVVPGGRGVWEFFGSLWGPVAILVVAVVLLGLPGLLGLGRDPKPVQEAPPRRSGSQTSAPRRQPAEPGPMRAGVSEEAPPHRSVPQVSAPRRQPAEPEPGSKSRPSVPPQEEPVRPHQKSRRGGYRPRH